MEIVDQIDFDVPRCSTDLSNAIARYEFSVNQWYTVVIGLLYLC